MAALAWDDLQPGIFDPGMGAVLDMVAFFVRDAVSPTESFSEIHTFH
jgi:hypothetical protein